MGRSCIADAYAGDWAHLSCFAEPVMSFMFSNGSYLHGIICSIQHVYGIGYLLMENRYFSVFITPPILDRIFA